MELLSPAGSFSALEAAIKNGADAVYFGGGSFNARLGAENFDDIAITRAIDYCHLHGVRAFITMNTLTHDRDLYSALSYAAFLYEMGADALIIQDLGLFSLIKKHIPLFELHASTQMCISTPSGVSFCEKLGFDRVVLSREVSMQEIVRIHKHSDMPLEVFVHGAMCMSFSGGCLFSSMVGGRSGNCGSCAQPCRKYAAIDKIPSDNDLALSLADMCMIDHVNELNEAGVISLKIEGRMKKPEYIAAVTHAYRRALDGASSDEIHELKKEMYNVFNRGDFTTGYYFGDNGRCGKNGNATHDKNLIASIVQRTEQQEKKIPLSLAFTAHTGEKATLIAKDNNHEVCILGDVVQVPNSPVTDKTIERYKAQLEKLGDSSFTAKQTQVFADGFLPVSSINDMRRNAIAELCAKYNTKKAAPALPKNIDMPSAKSSATVQQVCAHVCSSEQAMAAYKSGADEIILEHGFFSMQDIIELQSIRDTAKLFVSLPISLISEASREKCKSLVKPEYFDGIEINNPGQTEFAKDFNHIYGGTHLNVFNAYTAQLYLDMGIEKLALSLELNAAQIREITRCIPKEKLALHVYGRAILMNLYHCPIKESMGCNACGGTWHTLYDAEKRAFPIHGTMNSPCDVVRLYNCYAHDIIEKAAQSDMPCTQTLMFTTEDEKIVISRIKAAQNEQDKAPLGDTTRGYFARK